MKLGYLCNKFISHEKICIGCLLSQKSPKNKRLSDGWLEWRAIDGSDWLTSIIFIHLLPLSRFNLHFLTGQPGRKSIIIIIIFASILSFLIVFDSQYQRKVTVDQFTGPSLIAYQRWRTTKPWLNDYTISGKLWQLNRGRNRVTSFTSSFLLLFLARTKTRLGSSFLWLPALS